MRPSSSCSAGTLLRHWRTRRRLSQLALAAEAGVSQRHLSFVESGRAAASRDMLLHLAEHLDIPLRERNALLAAGGFAPVFPRHDLADAGFAPALAAVRTILAAHEPWPALAVDRSWTLVAANRALAPLLAAADAGLLAAPVNVLRLSLHPRGLGPQIVNYRDWRAHVLERLARDIALTADVGLLALRREIESYPVPAGAAPPGGDGDAPDARVAVPLRLATAAGVLSFLSTTTVFGTALDVTLAELTIETFLPADESTAAALRTTAAATTASAGGGR